MVTQDQTLKSLLNELIEEMTRLVRGEFRLVRAETHEKVVQLQTGVVAILSGLLLAFAALLVLLQAAVIALSNVMPASFSAIVVGGIVALIGWALIARGLHNLRANNLMPERTMQSIRDTRHIVEGRVS